MGDAEREATGAGESGQRGQTMGAGPRPGARQLGDDADGAEPWRAGVARWSERLRGEERTEAGVPLASDARGKERAEPLIAIGRLMLMGTIGSPNGPSIRAIHFEMDGEDQAGAARLSRYS